MRPDSDKQNEFEAARTQYLNATFGGEDAVLKAIRQKAAELGLEGMQVGASEGRILQSLVQWSGAKKVAEIGLFLGYSTVWMARALPPDGRLISFEKNESHYQLAKQFIEASDVASKVELKLGDAETEISQIESRGPFDLVFIDANKGSYLHYLDWAEKNVKKGGFIIGDNTFLFGLVFGHGREDRWSEKQIEGMKTFNSRLADSTRYQSCLLPTGEGITVARKLF